MTGENYFWIFPWCNTQCMNIFLEKLSEEYPDDEILLVCDGAAWHRSKALEVPSNITLLNIPPYTPEMNPIEQIWRELRTQGFRNKVFQTLEKVVDRHGETINNLSKETVQSITLRKWIKAIFI
ncbi:MAG: transposase [Oscillospiraceae bacterium]|nr:transposase [Oscillospiraceae bacterium]